MREDRRRLLERARLYLVVTPDDGGRWLEGARRALGTGLVGIVQLREKSAEARLALRRAAALAALAREHGALFVVNDRPDWAVESGADGVHVGEEDASPASARAVVGPDRLVGVSAHDGDEVRRAASEGADYAGLGPCFPTGTKRLRRAPGGPDLVRRGLRGATLPVFPIGGVTPSNAGALVAAGATRLAVGAGILDADDPAGAARELHRILSRAPPGGGVARKP